MVPVVGTAELKKKNAQKIIIVLSLERAKKAAFSVFHSAKVTTFLVQRSMRNRNKNCDG